MIAPIRRLAALVTSSPSAPISSISLGNERQSTDLGVATAFGNATAQRPVKSNTSFALLGTSAARAPIRFSRVHHTWRPLWEHCPALTITCD